VATRGTPLDDFTVRYLLRLRRGGVSVRRAAKEAGVSRTTARKYLRRHAAGKSVA
jgi:transposase